MGKGRLSTDNDFIYILHLELAFNMNLFYSVHLTHYYSSLNNHE